MVTGPIYFSCKMNKKHPWKSVIFSQVGGQWFILNKIQNSNKTLPQPFFLFLLNRTIYLVSPKQTWTLLLNWLNISIFVMILRNYFSCILFTCNHFCNILRLLMVEQIFLSPQVKRSIIFSNKLVYTSCLTSYRTT